MYFSKKMTPSDQLKDCTVFFCYFSNEGYRHPTLRSHPCNSSSAQMEMRH
uniref:Uncharacterized protein n=1 Tax=Anguilla anguilla TaxID=7936 RepID=A0A0E9WQC9_ANGAN